VEVHSYLDLCQTEAMPNSVKIKIVKKTQSSLDAKMDEIEKEKSRERMRKLQETFAIADQKVILWLFQYR
jgi:hypothetical protein